MKLASAVSLSGSSASTSGSRRNSPRRARKIRRLLAMLSLGFGLAAGITLATPAQAAVLTWDIAPGTVGPGNGTITGGAGTWDTTTGNWTTDGGTNNVAWPSSGLDNDAVFGDIGGVVAIAAGGVTANDLTFNVTGYSLTTNPLTLNGTTPTVTVTSSADTATINSVVSGSAGLVKSGAGTLTLSGTNNYTGNTVISQGTLISNNASALGATPRTVILGDGSTGNSDIKLQFNANNQTIASTTVANTGSTGTASIVVNTNPITLTSLVLNRSVVLAGTGGTPNNQVLNSNISGAGAGVGNDTVIVDSGVGNSLTMYVATTTGNTYTGNLRVKSGTLQIGSLTFNGNTAGNQNLSIPDAASVTVDSGALLRFVWTGTESFNSLNGAGTLDRNTGDGQGNVMLVIGGNNGSGSFSGAINSQFSITKSGTGTQSFTGANTYAGTTTIKNGTLALGAGSDRLPTGTTVTLGDVSTNDSGILKLNGSSQSLAGLVVAGTGTTNKVVNGNATSAILTINNSTANVFAGILGGSGTNENNFSVIKTGAGTLTLNTANTFTGVTASGDFTGLRISGGVVSTNLVALNNQPSGIGGGSASLGLNGGTFQYTGSGGAIERRLEVNTTVGSAIDASGTGALTWLTTGGFGGAGVGGARILTLTGTSTALNNMGVLLANPGNVANTLAVTKTGTGTWLLTAANTYTGATTLNAGKLLINNTVSTTSGVGTGDLLINGGTLGGTGYLGLAADASNITFGANGGTIAPGASAGILTVNGGVDFSSTGVATFAVELNSLTVGTGYDQLVVKSATGSTGVIDLDNAMLQVSLGFLPSVGDQFRIIDNQISTAGLTGNFNGLGNGSTFDIGATTFQINYDGGTGNDVVLTVVTAIPEPTSYAFLIAGGLLVGWTVRQRRRSESV